MKTSIVIATYNSPESLRKCLLSLRVQTRRPDEIIIADDGSGDATRRVVETFQAEFPRTQHVWHEDRGWTKPVILNLALTRVTADYVIFCDGDCVLRRDFVESHCRHARHRCFISGNPVEVPASVHAGFHDEDILTNRVFQFDCLQQYGGIRSKFRCRLHPGRWESLLNLATYRYCVFHGSNASAWLSDILSINGFDETFKYGSDDREFGVRLRNAGVRSRWLKHSLVQLHLGHPRRYCREQRQENRRRLRRLFFSGTTRIDEGIDTAVARAARRCDGNSRHQPSHGGMPQTPSSWLPEAVSDDCVSPALGVA
jgi:glycosyltransferase involved in cell wall biosynthesis